MMRSHVSEGIVRGVLCALLGSLFVSPASGQVAHGTGVVTLGVFGNGFVGCRIQNGPGFVFAFDQRLFHGQFMAGTAPDRVMGGTYYHTTDWHQVQAPSPSPPPAGFASAYTARFDDTGAATPMGLEIVQRSLGKASAAYIVLEYTLTNASAEPIDSLYAGLYMDWDLSGTDRHHFDATRGLLHTYDGFTGYPNRFGILSFHSNPRGISGYSGTPATPAFQAMTSMDAGIPSIDIVNTMGTGPYSLDPGENVEIRFAVVAGASLSGILANATAAQGQFPTAGEGGPTGARLVLHAVSPNPASGVATIRFRLPQGGEVEVAVLDVLGRRVASLDRRLAPHGDHSVDLDVRSLAAGTYLLELHAGGARVARPFTVVR